MERITSTRCHFASLLNFNVAINALYFVYDLHPSPRHRIMEPGVQTKLQSKRQRLAEAITSGRLYQTKMILEDNLNLNYIDCQGLSPLVRAFMIEDEKHRTRSAMVKLLLQHAADVNFRDDRGKHALNWVCHMNKLDLAKLLFEKCLQDLDLTSQDAEGNTPLMHAVKNDNADMVRLLVNAMRKFSLSVDQRNVQDRTPYYEAVEMGFEECANILSSVGNASRGIKVNPFLDFLGFTDATARSDKVRVRSAPPVKDGAGYGVGQRKGTSPRRRHAGKSDERKRKGLLFSGKKRGNRLRKSRKIHSEDSRKSHGPETVPGKHFENVPEEDSGRFPGKHCEKFPEKHSEKFPEKRSEKFPGNITRTGKNGHREGKAIALEDNSVREKSTTDRGVEPVVNNSPVKGNSASNEQKGFLRSILNGNESEVTSRRNSQSLASGVSTNPVSRSISPANETQERHKGIAPSINNFLECREVQGKDLHGRHEITCHNQQTDDSRDSENKSTNRNYFSCLEWTLHRPLSTLPRTLYGTSWPFVPNSSRRFHRIAKDLPFLSTSLKRMSSMEIGLPKLSRRFPNAAVVGRKLGGKFPLLQKLLV